MHKRTAAATHRDYERQRPTSAAGLRCGISGKPSQDVWAPIQEHLAHRKVRSVRFSRQSSTELADPNSASGHHCFVAELSLDIRKYDREDDAGARMANAKGTSLARSLLSAPQVVRPRPVVARSRPPLKSRVVCRIIQRLRRHIDTLGATAINKAAS